MKSKVLSALLLASAVVLLAGVSVADQVTLLPSGVNILVSNTGGTTTFGITGSGLSGIATYPDTSPFFGSYTFWFGSGTMPSLSLVSPFNYAETMGSATMWVHVCVQTCTGGSNPGEFIGQVTLQQLTTFNPAAPQLSGLIKVTSSSGQLAADFPVSSVPIFDVNLTKISPTGGVDFVYLNAGTSVKGAISSGEIIPVPEPGTLILVGSGLVAIAGAVRRRKL